MLKRRKLKKLARALASLERERRAVTPKRAVRVSLGA
jgi:hypothetical protein